MVLEISLSALLAMGSSDASAQSAPTPADSGRVLTARASADSLPSEEPFPAALGAFTTSLIGSRAERTANIALAAATLDGTVLEPGEQLSFNAIVGPRTMARGYRDAPVILHETRQLQPGGGVCQVASTVFAAGLLSGLASVERWRHSSPVDYIAPGEDATIAWGAKDMKLRNDTCERVRLRVSILGATLTARFDAEAATGETFELGTEERELPADSAAPDARSGSEIELYRVRRDAHGNESREFVHRDVYPPSQGRRDAP